MLGHIGGRCLRRPKAALEAAEDALTLADAADGEVVGGPEAIGGSVDIVGDNHAGVPGARLVQGAQLPKVRLALRELPLALMQGLVVEVCEGHAAGTAVLHRHQEILHGLAGGVLPAEELIRHLVDHAHGTIKADVARLDLELHCRSQRLLRDGPVGVDLVHASKEALKLRAVGVLGIEAEDVARRVELEGLHRGPHLDAPLRQSEHGVDCAQALAVLLVDLVLEQRSQRSHPVQVEARPCELRMDVAADVQRETPEQHCVERRGLVPCLALWVKALQQPAALLQEEPVQHIAHGGGAEAPVVVCRHRRERRLQLHLEVRKVVLG
mmetsp:Transcript_68313/g.211200  ORF Transcript_68313/g.211200 Transcript_68313/m.211200 type:complete len:325 (-) Transcript_68313:263-1237(-)